MPCYWPAPNCPSWSAARSLRHNPWMPRQRWPRRLWNSHWRPRSRRPTPHRPAGPRALARPTQVPEQPNRGTTTLEIKWLEDFLSLAESGSFSRSAEQRHVTQPAFSRRIRALENWVGAELIDRTSYPTKLTAAGEAFRERAAEIVQDVFDTRATLRGQRPIAADTLSFAVPHALSLNFYPKWLTKLERSCFDGAPLATRLVALNVHDAVMALVGRGVAGLPDSAVARELKSRQLALAGGELWWGEMEIRLYRERRSMKAGAKPLLDQLWMYLEASTKPGARKK